MPLLSPLLLCAVWLQSSSPQVEASVCYKYVTGAWGHCADAATVELAKKMTGGMRLTLTEQESAARQSVLLPWEQRQAGAESQDELVSASRKASTASKAEAIQAAGEGASYGQIFYERDSETDPDSDEDPDDDLDI